MSEHQNSVITGCILTAIGFGGTAYHLYYFLQTGIYYDKVAVLLPYFGFFGLVMIFFPELSEGSGNLRDYSTSQILICILALIFATCVAGIQLAYFNGYTVFSL